MEREYFTEYNGHLLETTRELSMDVSTEELLSGERAFKYADLYALLGKELYGGVTLAWVTQPAVIMLANGRRLLSSFDMLSECTFSLIVMSKCCKQVARMGGRLTLRCISNRIVR
jgi:hypothetical protein